MNFFAWFELPLSLQIDKSDLRRRFYLKSREVHPDHQADADMQAALNNEAFRVLSDDDARYRHVLQLHQVTSLDHEPLPQEFLLEMMELNEAIAEAETIETIAELKEQVQKWEQQLAESIAPYQQSWPTQQPELDAALTALKNFVIKRKYLLRIQENLSKFATS